MAEVITWRQMAGPNFAGTASAMDAGADRINQMATTFQQLAQDQTRIQAEAKAKRTKDNTAKVLSQLGSINDLNALNQQMPNFSFDSLRGQYGDEIDAGLVSQTANKQAGVIQDNQLRDMEFNIAKEKPIMGQASETIAGLLNKGDIEGAKAAYQQYASQLTDATPLADMISKYEAEQFDRKLQSNADARDEKRTAMAEKEHKITIDSLTDVQNVKPLIDKVASGEITPAEAAKQVKTTDGTIKLIQGLELTNSFNELDPKQKVELSVANAKIANDVQRKETEIGAINRELDMLPVEDPAVMAFATSMGGDRQKINNQLGTPSNVISTQLEKIKVAGSEFFDFQRGEKRKDTITPYLERKLKEADIKLSEVDPLVMKAAIDHWQLNDEGGIDTESLDMTVNRIKDYQVKQEEYKNNKVMVDAKKSKLALVSKKLASKSAELSQSYLRLKEIEKQQRNMKGFGVKGTNTTKGFEELNTERSNLYNRIKFLESDLNKYTPDYIRSVANGNTALQKED